MKNQPFLTDFPLTVFATARRRLQAAIRSASAIVTRNSLSGYSVLFADVLLCDDNYNAALTTIKITH